MTVKQENIVKETEKAICLTIGLKMNDNGEMMFINGKPGFFTKVNAWFPKSQIVDNEIPTWLASAKMKEAHFNITDIIY